MTQILGVVGSARRWGNSEIVIRHALQGARDQGATVEMVRLTDLRLEACTGCMRCVIGSKPCPLDDDMEWLIQIIQEADGLVLAAPTYFLGPAAVIKLVLDRLLMVTGRLSDAFPPPRPAATIATAGLEGWRGVTLPYFNALVAAFGYRPIASLLAVAPGPGEVLLDDALMDQVLAAGERLGRLELGTESEVPGTIEAPAATCPVCTCDAFVLSGSRALCPICGSEAIIHWSEAGAQLHFQAEAEGHGRWTPEGLRAHMTDWVQATGPRYLAHRPEIKARRAPFRQVDLGWLRPPESGEDPPPED